MIVTLACIFSYQDLRISELNFLSAVQPYVVQEGSSHLSKGREVNEEPD